MNETIRVFIGCSANGEDAESQMVLEHSIHKHCSAPVEIVWMNHRNMSGWDGSAWNTPFSGFRWAVPELCDFKGQAIYLDSDVIVNADLKELWDIDWNEQAIIMMKGDRKTCVSKWHCERAKKYITPISVLKQDPRSHKRLSKGVQMNEHLQQRFDSEWNNLDGEDSEIDNIKILHYTNVRTQLHLKYALPRLAGRGQTHWCNNHTHVKNNSIQTHTRGDLVKWFDQLYREALQVGYTVERYIPAGSWINYK